MSATTPKQRITLNNLNEPQQLRELNRQLEWVWNQLMGGLTQKALSEGLSNVIESKAEREELDDLGNTVSRQNTLIQQNAAAIAAKANQTAVDSLGNRVSSAETALTLTATRAELASTANGLRSEIGASADEIMAHVGSIQIGGENLMTGTQYFDGDDWTRLTDWEEYPNRYAGCKVLGKNTAWNPPEQKIWVEAGQQYTFSAWLSGQNGYTISIQGHINRESTTDACVVEENIPLMTDTLTSEWKRCSFTATVTQSGWAEPRFEAMTGGGYWYICGMKFERGNRATDWSPAAGELYAGSTLRMNKDEVWIGTPLFGVDINNSSQRFQLDAGGGSFDTLSVKNLQGDNNVARTYRGPGLITIGAGGTYGSLSQATSELNGKILLYNVTIRLLGDLVENASFTGIMGGYSVGIDGQNHTLYGSLALNRNGADMIVVDLTVSGGQTTVSGGGYTDFARDTFRGRGDGTQTYGVLIEHGARVRLMNCAFYNATNLVCASELSNVWMNGSKGGNCTYFLWGYASTVRVTGSRPNGAVRSDNEPIYMPANPASVTVNGGDSTPPVPAVTTASLTATLSGAYGPNGWLSNENDIIQGRYGSGQYRGCMWFDGSSLSGQTIRSATLTLKRIAGSGWSGEITLTLYGMTLSGKSGNPAAGAVSYGILGTIGNGETKVFTLPTAAAQAIANGTATGFMLYAGNEGLINGRQYSANYGRIEGTNGSAPVMSVTY